MTEKRYFFAGWLIDGSGNEVQKRVCLVVESGKISSIGAIEEFKNIDPSLVTDLSHCTLLPPLIDCNVNLSSSATVDQQRREIQAQAGFDEISPLITQHIHFCQSHGVLGVGDDGYNNHVSRYKKNTSGDDIRTVTIKSAARLYHNDDCNHNNSGGCKFPSATFSNDSDRFDYVKIISSEEVCQAKSPAAFSSYFKSDELHEIISTAEKKGKKVMVLANGESAVNVALKAGCHAIVQGAFMGDENLRHMAESGTVWVPTILSMKTHMENDGSVNRDVVTRYIKKQLEQLLLARTLGVKVALGTGAGSSGIIHGESAVEEIKYFIKGGYSLVEAIRCATANGIELLSISDMGLLQPGKIATFIVSRGMPAQLPRKLTYLEAIYINGEPSKAYRKNPIKKVF